MKNHPKLSPNRPPAFHTFWSCATGLGALNLEVALVQGDGHSGFGSPAVLTDHLHVADKRSRECSDSLFKLQKIARKAEAGDLHCYELLLFATTKLVSLLNAASAAQPDYHTLLASHSATWPAHFPYDHGSTAQINKRLASSGLGFYFKALDVPKIKSELQLYAVMLILYMRLLRCGLYAPQLHAHVRQCCALKRLDATTWTDWWAVASKILLSSYPDLTKLDGEQAGHILSYTRNAKRRDVNKPISDAIRDWFERVAPALGKLPENRLETAAIARRRSE